MVLFVALVARPFLPGTVRVSLPELWNQWLPRVEFVRDGVGQGKGRLARADAASAPESGSNAPLGITRNLPLDAIGMDGREGGGASKSVRVVRNGRSRRSAQPVMQPPRDETDELEDVGYAPDSPVTLIPTKFRTEIRLTSAITRDEAVEHGATRPAEDHADAARSDEPRGERAADQDWPLLCGEVVDGSGVPVEGARVELEAPRLTEVTDAKGRFCLACPAGVRTLRIEAGGRGRATRVVTLQGSLFGLRIPLSQTP